MHYFVTAVMLVLLAMSASAQSLAPPSRPVQSWDTETLVSDAGRVMDVDLPRLRERATAGDARSQVLLGLVYEMGGAGLTASSTEALAWFTRAAERGVTWAQVWAGDFYYTGSTGVPRDLFKALELYRTAAEAGDPRGAFFVGQMYFYGDGVNVNLEEAARWFRRAVPMDEDVMPRLVTLAETPCRDRLCQPLRQMLGAVTTGAQERFAGGWNTDASEWDTTHQLPELPRCGFTSSDRTENGEIRNYFCDSEPIVASEAGSAQARRLADAVEAALGADWTRRESTDRGGGPAIFFSRDGYPHIRVSYNTTPGKATQRVTLLIGP